MKRIIAITLILCFFTSLAYAYPYEIGLITGESSNYSLSDDETEVITVFPEADTMINENAANTSYADVDILKIGENTKSYLRFNSSFSGELLTNCIPENCTRSKGNGLGVFTLNTTDPRIRFENLNVNCKNLTSIEVRIKNNTPATKAAIYYKIEDDSVYSSSKRIQCTISSNDGNYKTYFFSIYNLSNLTDSDIITGLRFDFVDNASDDAVGKSVAIDYIKLNGVNRVNLSREKMTQFYADNCDKASGTGLGLFTLKTADPRIRFEHLNISGGLFYGVEVKMKNNTSATQMAIYYKREGDSNYSSAQRINMDISAADSSLKTYYFDIFNGDKITESDVITGIRLDFVEGAVTEDIGQSVEIETVKFDTVKKNYNALNRKYKAELVFSPVNAESNRKNFNLYGIIGEEKKSWDENSTYNLMQNNGVTAADSVLIATGVNDTILDVTEYVNSQDDGIYTFVFESTGDDEDYLHSSRKSDFLSPKLILTPYIADEYDFLNSTTDEVKIMKNTSANDSGTLLFALYDNKGALSGSYVKPLDFSKLLIGDVKTLSDLNFIVPTDKNVSSAKTFLWSDLETLLPLAETKVLQEAVVAEALVLPEFEVDEEVVADLTATLDLELLGLDNMSVSSYDEKQEFLYKITQYFKNRATSSYFYDAKTKSKQINEIKDDVTYIDGVVSEAEKVMGYKNLMWNAEVDFDDPNVWNFEIYNPSYNTYGSMINRLEWIIPVCQAYWITDNDKYADFVVRILNNWIDANPLTLAEPVNRGEGTGGLPWNDTLDVGIRLQNLCRIFQYIRCYEKFDVESYVKFLSVIRRHAEFLAKQQEGGYFGGNWQTQECDGLIQASLLFPEFVNSSQWYSIAMDRISEHTSQAVVQEDGTYLEPVPGYFADVRQNIFNVVSLSEINGLTVDAEVSNKLEKMFEWFMSLTLQDGSLPVPGDTAKTNQQKYIALGASLFERGDMKYVSQMSELPSEFIWSVSKEQFDAFKNLQSTKPENVYTLLPNGQYIVLRDDWGNLGTGNSLFFDVNQASGGHNHYDYLNIEAVFGGERLLTESGHIGYSHPQREIYGVGGIGHNLALVDDGTQQNVWLSDSLPEITSSYFSDSYDFVEGRAIYPETENSEAFEWRRAVVYLKPDVYVISDYFIGSDKHELNRYFHTAANNTVEILTDVHGVKMSGSSNSMYIISAPETGLSVTNDDGLGAFTSKQKVAVFNHDATFPSRSAVVIANGNKGEPAIEKITEGSYRISYDSRVWVVSFANESTKSEITVTEIK